MWIFLVVRLHLIGHTFFHVDFEGRLNEECTVVVRCIPAVLSTQPLREIRTSKALSRGASSVFKNHIAPWSKVFHKQQPMNYQVHHPLPKRHHCPELSANQVQMSDSLQDHWYLLNQEECILQSPSINATCSETDVALVGNSEVT